MRLTEGQQKALDAMREGRNVLLSGDAGTGKSFVVDVFLEECEDAGVNVLAMAPTGVAAQNLRGGSTIHRALGLGSEFQDARRADGKIPRVLRVADVIVIDEFSMCRVDLFDVVAKMIRRASTKERKQVIVVGDPCQLPPVVTRNDAAAMRERYGDGSVYCFESKQWNEFGFEPHLLTEVMRQRGDEELSAMLALAREGDDSCVDYFNSHVLADPSDAPDGAVWLCPRNADAAKINTERLGAIGARAYRFDADSNGSVTEQDKPTDDTLLLKVGARVMAVANDPELQYANGSLGTVIAINANSDNPVTVAFDDGIVATMGWRRWDIRKSVVVETDKRDTNGNPVTKIESQVIGTFEQIPLRLAWAMTIHKAQGKSFSEVCVDTRTFAKGQLYVALSRATSFDGLHVFPRIKEGRLVADETAADFYRSLVEGREWRSATESDSPRIALSHDGTETVLRIPEAVLDEALRALVDAGFAIDSEA